MATRPHRFTPGHGSLKDLWNEFLSLYMIMMFSTTGSPAIGNGGTAGRLRTNASTTGRIAGVDVTKASTDDLWDLHGETATAAATFRAYWLYISSAGAASFVAGTDQSTAALALANLPAPDPTKCIFGVYVAGGATDFTAALGAQGTVYNGIPDGARAAATNSLLLHKSPAVVTLVRG